VADKVLFTATPPTLATPYDTERVDVLGTYAEARDPEARRARREAAEAARLRSLRESRRALTIGRLRGHAHELTVREAASVLERYEGELQVKGGRALIVSPGFGQDWQHRELREAVEVLVAAEPLIAAAAPKSGGVVAPEKLPDAPVSPSGALLT
jgi:hypothetical protein